jgi:hypothetical protein
MRIQFKKGISPGAIAERFLDIVKKRGNVIGTVNIYVQEYNQDMQLIEFDNSRYIQVSPTVDGLDDYAEYCAGTRRNNLRVV